MGRVNALPLRRPPARPYVLSFRFSQAELDELNARVARSQRTASEIVHEALRRYFEEAA